MIHTITTAIADFRYVLEPVGQQGLCKGAGQLQGHLCILFCLNRSEGLEEGEGRGGKEGEGRRRGKRGGGER